MSPLTLPRYVPPRRRTLALIVDALLVVDGRTQLEIAFATGVDQAVISRLRRCLQDVSRPTLEALADALDLSPINRARLLCAAGLLPIEHDPVFTEIVCQVAAKRLTRSAKGATL